MAFELYTDGKKRTSSIVTPYTKINTQGMGLIIFTRNTIKELKKRFNLNIKIGDEFLLYIDPKTKKLGFKKKEGESFTLKFRVYGTLSLAITSRGLKEQLPPNKTKYLIKKSKYYDFELHPIQADCKST